VLQESNLLGDAVLYASMLSRVSGIALSLAVLNPSSTRRAFEYMVSAAQLAAPSPEASHVVRGLYDILSNDALTLRVGVRRGRTDIDYDLFRTREVDIGDLENLEYGTFSDVNTLSLEESISHIVAEQAYAFNLGTVYGTAHYNRAHDEGITAENVARHRRGAFGFRDSTPYRLHPNLEYDFGGDFKVVISETNGTLARPRVECK
jgi:hypothetical protein